MKKFKIYQLPVENNAKFMGLEFVTEHNIMPKLEDYNLVYEGEVEDDADLDDIYRMLNVARPKDYKGHSLSVSDVVEIGGYYFYCDSFGWEEVYKTSFIVTSDGVDYIAECETEEEAEEKAEALNDEYYQRKIWGVQEVEVC